jgi:hypothetical protein
MTRIWASFILLAGLVARADERPVPPCRMDDSLPPRVAHAAKAAWRTAIAGHPDLPKEIAINPRRRTSALRVYFINDAIEGMAPCASKRPGNGDGSLRKFDEQTVLGFCRMDAGAMYCSSDAIRALLEVEERPDLSPSLVYLFAHEYGHRILGHAGAFSEGVAAVELTNDFKRNLAAMQIVCEADVTQEKKEEAADEFAFDVARKVFSAPPYRPKGAAVLESVLANAEVVYWTARNLSDWGFLYYGAPNAEPFPTLRELCDFVSRPASVIFPVYGGEHPQAWNRLATIVNQTSEYVKTLHAKNEKLGREDLDLAILGMNVGTDNLRATAFTAFAKVFCERLAGIENRSIDCAQLPATKDEKSIQVDLFGAKREPPIDIPLAFAVRGPYREVEGEAVAAVIFLQSIEFMATRDRALDVANEMRDAYDAFLSEVDGYLKEHGGYWLHEVHQPVRQSFNTFGRQYQAIADVHAMVRAPRGFDPRKLRTFAPMLRWGRLDDVRAEPWDTSKRGAVIHFFRPGTKQSIKDSQRVLTRGLRPEETFDLARAREGHPNEPAAAFRDLLSYLKERLQAKFGGEFTLVDPSAPSPVFYLSAEHDFALPPAWAALAGSIAPRTTSDAELRNMISTVFIDNSDEEDLASIFGP